MALEALPEGTTGRDPVRSRFGWHVLRLQRKIEGRTLPFEMVRDKIADMLEARAWAVAAANYAAGLARSAEIEGVLIDPAALGDN
jgi:peptidyl-prolyl cis-trans isomerase C